MTINQVVFEGRVFQDPGFHPNDEAKRDYFHCSIGVSQGRNKESKEWRPTLFLKMKAWGGLARICRDHVAPGTVLVVSGRLVPDDYKKKDGTVSKGVAIIASAVTITVRPGDPPVPQSDDGRDTVQGKETLYGDDAQESMIPF